MEVVGVDGWFGGSEAGEAVAVFEAAMAMAGAAPVVDAEEENQQGAEGVEEKSGGCWGGRHGEGGWRRWRVQDWR